MRVLRKTKSNNGKPKAEIRERFVAHKRLEKSTAQLTNELRALEVRSSLSILPSPDFAAGDSHYTPMYIFKYYRCVCTSREEICTLQMKRGHSAVFPGLEHKALVLCGDTLHADTIQPILALLKWGSRFTFASSPSTFPFPSQILPTPPRRKGTPPSLGVVLFSSEHHSRSPSHLLSSNLAVFSRHYTRTANPRFGYPVW